MKRLFSHIRHSFIYSQIVTCGVKPERLTWTIKAYVSKQQKSENISKILHLRPMLNHMVLTKINVLLKQTQQDFYKCGDI